MSIAGHQLQPVLASCRNSRKTRQNCQMSTADFVALAKGVDNEGDRSWLCIRAAPLPPCPGIFSCLPSSLLFPCTPCPKVHQQCFLQGLAQFCDQLTPLSGTPPPFPPLALESSPAFASREILLGKVLWKVLTHDLRVRRQCQRQQQRRLHLISYLCGAHAHPLGHAHFQSAGLRRDLCGRSQSVSSGGRGETWPPVFTCLQAKLIPTEAVTKLV